MNAKVKLYSAVGEELTHYDVDVDGLTLTKRKTIKVPSVVQYAWPHPSKRHLYVTTSNRGAGMKSDFNHVSALTIDPASGELAYQGAPVPLCARAVHLCLTADAKYLLNAHNLPRASITVHRISADGSIGAEVAQPEGLAFGIYPHQVLVSLQTGTVMLIDRGNDANKGKPEDPGALRLFRIKDGALANLQAVAPNGGYGFGPRHIDFHPTEPWMFVSIETQNQLHVHRMQGGKPLPEVVFNKTTLLEPGNIRSRQAASTVHVHPNGRFVYGANRSQDVVDFRGKKVYKGGENSIVVYTINQQTGEPSAIQHIETTKFHPRTFHIDPSGHMLVAQHNLPLDVRDGDNVRTVPAGLSVFRMGADGTLTLARTYDIDVGDKSMWWLGMVPL